LRIAELIRHGYGSWWFHLRTHDHGKWTDTVHVGPFIVTGSTAVAPPIPASAF
jgi:hypothetical protein